MTDLFAEVQVVVVDAAAVGAVRFRVADMRVIKAITGVSLPKMLAGDDDENRIQAVAFMQLRRADPDAPAERLWERAELVDVELVAPTPVPPDPTSAGS